MLMLNLCLVYGHQPDSLALKELLQKGIKLETTDKQTAMTLYSLDLSRADSAGIFSVEVDEMCEKLANYEYYRGNPEYAITLALRSLGFYEEQSDKNKR